MSSIVLLLLGCSRRDELESCNIANKSCQIDIYYAVVRLRGDGFDPFEGLPPIRTLTIDQARQGLTEGEPTSPPTDPLDPEMKVQLDPWKVALQWFGLVTLDRSSVTLNAAIDNRVNNVAAFYSSRTQEVTVIDRGEERNDRGDTTLLTHELVHAFQDNEVGLEISAPSSDGGFAARAFTEGEAVLYEKLAGAEIDGVSPEELLWDEYYESWLSGLRGGLSADPSPFYAVSWFVYPLGAAMLTRGWLDGGNAAVRKLAGQIPQTALGYMQRFDELPEQRSGEALDCTVAPPEERFARVGYDRFGAMHLYAFLGAAGVTEAEAWRLAHDWRDDLFYLFFDEARQEVAVSWRVRTTNEDSAEAIVAAAEKRPTLRAVRIGADALIVASSASVLSWAGATQCAR